MASVLEQRRSRWLLVGVGFLANLCMGSIYAFSVFRKPLEALWGLSATLSGLPFMVFLAVFAGAMALAGGLLETWGPRRVSILGALFVGAGWLLAGFSPNIAALTAFYGVIAGAGVGLAYGAPIAVASRWFPDRRGLAVGLTVMGFGASPLVTAPIMNALISTVGPLRTFTILGAVFLGLLVLLALPLRFPPSDSAPKSQGGKAEAGKGLGPREMLRMPAFYALWTTFTIGCLSGLMAIGIAAPFGREVVNLSQTLSAVAVSIFAVFNAFGRPLFGWLTDRLTPRYSAILSFGLILLSSLALGLFGKDNTALYFLGFGILWMNLGGWLAIAPTATATLFGTENYGRNYGIVFTAYGAGAILGNILSGLLRDLTGSYLGVFLPVAGLATFGVLVAFVGLRPVQQAKGM
ncbi:OFA family MFS transporter [Candidatus Bipolaricaulota bacterium]|nr:OFA family MFS transporter [Candidatus Bipolaricaulota bacterium]